MSGRHIVEAIGVAAVVVSLIFVGTEIRQNTRIAQSAAYQQLGIATADTWNGVAHDAQFNEFLAKDLATWTQSEWQQRRAYWMVWLRLLETLQIQIEQGLLPGEAVGRLGYGSVETWAQRQDFACLWPGIGATVSQAVRDLVEAVPFVDGSVCAGYDLPPAIQ